MSSFVEQDRIILENGVCSELESGESLSSDLMMFVYTGFSNVRRIDDSGAVEGET